MKRLDSVPEAREENLKGRQPESPECPAPETYRRGAMTCCFGATRVGPLLARLRLHLTTDRFLARRRSDVLWEVACDYSTMTLAYVEMQLSRDGLARPLPRSMPVASSLPAEDPR